MVKRRESRANLFGEVGTGTLVGLGIGVALDREVSTDEASHTLVGFVWAVAEIDGTAALHESEASAEH